jgi:hypothetical protein
MKVLRIRTATNNPEDNLRIIPEVKVRATKATVEAKATWVAAVAKARAKVEANPEVSLVAADRDQLDVQAASQAK